MHFAPQCTEGNTVHTSTEYMCRFVLKHIFHAGWCSAHGRVDALSGVHPATTLFSKMHCSIWPRPPLHLLLLLLWLIHLTSSPHLPIIIINIIIINTMCIVILILIFPSECSPPTPPALSPYYRASSTYLAKNPWPAHRVGSTKLRPLHYREPTLPTQPFRTTLHLNQSKSPPHRSSKSASQTLPEDLHFSAFVQNT